MSIIIWQALSIEISHRWSPIKLEGDFKQGYILLADLHRPRLGLRWHTPNPKRLDVQATINRQMLEEVGQLAAKEATDFVPSKSFEFGKIYIEPKPPGRDIWIGYSPASRRIIQVVHHAHRREHLLRDAVLPTLTDLPDVDPRPWSIFDLSCRVPKDFVLESRQLNVGDHLLEFSAPAKPRPRRFAIRQIAVAELALKRKSIDGWLASLQHQSRKQYRVTGNITDIIIEAAGRKLEGRRQWLNRRKRYFWVRRLHPQLLTLALHDAQRDRLLLIETSEEDLAKAIGPTIGWAEQI